MIATKKATFHVRNCRSHECNGLERGPISPVRTILRLQAGAGGTEGGITKTLHERFENWNFKQRHMLSFFAYTQKVLSVAEWKCRLGLPVVGGVVTNKIFTVSESVWICFVKQ